jgi:hypothetical protein
MLAVKNGLRTSRAIDLIYKYGSSSLAVLGIVEDLLGRFETQLPANDVCIDLMPAIVTNSAPLPVMVDLHAAFVPRVSTD